MVDTIQAMRVWNRRFRVEGRFTLSLFTTHDVKKAKLRRIWSKNLFYVFRKNQILQ